MRHLGALEGPGREVKRLFTHFLKIDRPNLR